MLADETENRVAPRPQTVRTDTLVPNPHNPRLLFDKLPLKTLEDSIRKVGVLVPLVVYQAKGSSKFTILDGQRRWICAANIGLTEVPINQVAEPTVSQNIVTMFQIHKLRRDWELMPTALKLGVLMKELNERRDAQLAELTGLDVAVVSRCKKLLTFPRKYQEMMLYAEPEDRIKADFFIELYPVLTDRLVSKAPWFKRDKVTERFLYKYQNKLSGFKSIIDFRKIKQFISVARAAGQEKELLERLHALIDDDNVSIADLEIDVARAHREAVTLTRSVTRLRDDLALLDTDQFFGEEELWTELEKLIEILRAKFAKADRRLRD